MCCRSLLASTIPDLPSSYKQALQCAQESKALAAKHSLPFTRPNDYFAEMVKSDIHMERVRSKLLDEAAAMKRSAEAKRQRDLKKYGKQVQVEKTKERAKNKKEMLNKVESLKRSARFSPLYGSEPAC